MHQEFKLKFRNGTFKHSESVSGRCRRQAHIHQLHHMPEHQLIDMNSSFDMDEPRKLYMHQWLPHGSQTQCRVKSGLTKIDMSIKDCEGDTRHGWSNRPQKLEGGDCTEDQPMAEPKLNQHQPEMDMA